MSVTLRIEMQPSTDETVTSRPVQVVNSADGSESTVECIDPNEATFEVEPGSYGYCTPLGDVNENGPGPPGENFTWSVPIEAEPDEPPEPEPIEGLAPVPIITGTKLAPATTPKASAGKKKGRSRGAESERSGHESHTSEKG